MRQDKQNNANLKEVLPYGSMKKIALRSKKSIYTVSRVVNGGSNNTDVMNSIKDYLQEMNANKKELRAIIEESKMAC